MTMFNGDCNTCSEPSDGDWCNSCHKEDFKIKFLVKEKNPVVLLYGEEVNILEIPDGTLTLDFYLNTRANSDGFEALYPKLNNEALAHAVQNNLNNCGYKSNTTYEGSLQNILVPLLLKRLEELS